MEQPQQNRPERSKASSDLSDITFSSSSTFVQSNFDSTPDPGKYASVSEDGERGITYNDAVHRDTYAQGLQISLNGRHRSHKSFVASSQSSPEVPGSGRRLLPFPSPGAEQQGFCTPPETRYAGHGYFSAAHNSSAFIDDRLCGDDESIQRLRPSTPGSSEPKLASGELRCEAKRPIETSRTTWISTIILLLSIYSTLFSAIFLYLAAKGPRHKTISPHGKFSFSTASLLCAAIAKSIEIASVTVFVAVLGQRLTHIARQKNSKGISIADLMLRQWVQQPGTLFTHWQSVRHATIYLGTATIAATILSLLYTTASDALVAPKLKFDGEQMRTLQGEVKTMFVNNSYQVEHCKTPISMAEDWNAGTNCMEHEHAGQAFHNYMQYLPSWSKFKDRSPEGSTKMSERPPPVGLLWDNTTVVGRWVEEADVANTSAEYNRLINNVTLAMPLAAVVNAATHETNHILQPRSSEGLGEYYIHASVPSPSINVVCAAMTDEEMDPLIYLRWPFHEVNGTDPEPSGWPGNSIDKIPRMPSFLNKTAVDDIFGWGEQHGRRHPIFYRVPNVFKTVVNTSDEVTPDGYNSDSVYVIATSNTTNSSQLCSIRASMYPHCSTKYHASVSGGNLTAHCNEPGNDLQYNISRPDAPSGLPNFNWTAVSNSWALTVGLGSGRIDNPTTNARLLSELMLSGPLLNPRKPSLAEALAVQAGCTIINTALDSPLIHYWDQPNQTYLDAPFFQSFKSTVKSQVYASGFGKPWQCVFFVVLVGTLLINIVCLVYLLVFRGLITDFMEPHNLMALAINSPPSRALEGSCGGGPEDEQWFSRWHIDEDVKTKHFYLESRDAPKIPQMKKRKPKARQDSGLGIQMQEGRSAAHYERLQ